MLRKKAWTSKRNILAGNPNHAQPLIPDSLILLRGTMLAARFPDHTLIAVQSASSSCSHGPNRPSRDPLLAQPCITSPLVVLLHVTDLWACFLRDWLVSERLYVVLCDC
jgi:hypothetical protein